MTANQILHPSLSWWCYCQELNMHMVMFGFSFLLCLKLKWHKLKLCEAYCFYQLSPLRRITPPPARPHPRLNPIPNYTKPPHCVCALLCTAEQHSMWRQTGKFRKITWSLNVNQGIGWCWTMDINVLALSTGPKWRLAAITQHWSTDSTATTNKHQGPCCVYK